MVDICGRTVGGAADGDAGHGAVVSTASIQIGGSCAGSLIRAINAASVQGYANQSGVATGRLVVVAREVDVMMVRLQRVSKLLAKGDKRLHDLHTLRQVSEEMARPTYYP